MVDFTSGSLFQPIQFDFTSGIKFLQEQQKINIERERLELQKQQEEFDQGVERQGRAGKNRLIAAEAFRAEEAGKQSASQRRTEEQAFEINARMNSALEGVTGFVQEKGNDLDALEGAFESIDAVTPKIVNGSLKGTGTSFRKGANVNSEVAKVFSRPFVDHLQLGLSEGDLNIAAIGVNQRKSPFKSLFTPTMNKASERVVSSAITGVNKATGFISDRIPTVEELHAQNPAEAISVLSSMRSELANQTESLAHPAFASSLDEARGALDNINEALKQVDQLEAQIRAGDGVLADPGKAAVTGNEIAGVNKRLDSSIALYRGSSTPDQNLDLAVGTIVNSDIWPTAAVGVFTDATESTDPVSQVKASMFLDRLKGQLGRNADSEMYDSISAAGKNKGVGLKESLLRISAARRTYFEPTNVGFSTENEILNELNRSAAEIGPSGGPATERLSIAQQAWKDYTQTIVDRVDQSFSNQGAVSSLALSEESGKQLKASSVEGQTTEDSRIARTRSLASQEIGENEKRFFTSVDVNQLADFYDVDSPSDLPTQFYDDYWLELTTNANLESTSLEAQRPAASANQRKNWSKPWVIGDVENKAVNDHPVKFARAQWGDQMSEDLAADVFYYQLLPELAKSGGEVLELDQLSIEKRVGFNNNGEVFEAYNVSERSNGNLLVEGYVPDYTPTGLRDVVNTATRFALAVRKVSVDLTTSESPLDFSLRRRPPIRKLTSGEIDTIMSDPELLERFAGTSIPPTGRGVGIDSVPARLRRFLGRQGREDLTREQKVEILRRGNETRRPVVRGKSPRLPSKRTTKRAFDNADFVPGVESEN